VGFRTARATKPTVIATDATISANRVGQPDNAKAGFSVIIELTPFELAR
jgi:hypothetical protein